MNWWPFGESEEYDDQAAREQENLPGSDNIPQDNADLSDPAGEE
jgi:hypothetical protein